MEFRVVFSPRSRRDLERLPPRDAARVIERTENLKNNLAGDVKKLTNFSPEYRLRVGDYRVLFDLAGDTVIARRVLHRKDAYE